MSLWPFTFAVFPLLHTTITSGGSEPGSHHLSLLWIEIVMLMLLSRFGCLAYSYVWRQLYAKFNSKRCFDSVSLILCKDHAPGPTALAKTNGLVLLGMCIARAIAPAFVRSVANLFPQMSPSHRLPAHGVIALCLRGLSNIAS